MLRVILAILVWALLCLVLGIPVLLVGLVYPSRRLLAWSSRIWSRAMLASAGVQLTVSGTEHIDLTRPTFYMANHQSALDIPIMALILRGDVRFFTKKTLFYIPIFGWALWRYGFIPIDKSSPRRTHRTLERLLERLRRNPISIAVYPEGTRTRDGTFSVFRKGTMRVATKAGFAVVPVAIDGSLAVNHRDEYRFRPGPVHVTITDPIPADVVSNMTPTELQERVVKTLASVLQLDSVSSAESCVTKPMAV